VNSPLCRQKELNKKGVPHSQDIYFNLKTDHSFSLLADVYRDKRNGSLS
jgi:hypothetical protein